MTTGLYKLVNTTNGHRYYGSAVNTDKRWKFHIWKLNRGQHENPRLQRAWVKYGDQSFQFTLLRRVSKTRLLAEEQKLLDHHVGKPYCYNIAKSAAAPMLGRTHSKATKERIGQSNSIALVGNTPWNKGGTSWSKGQHLSPQHRSRISTSNQKIVGEATSLAKLTEEQVLWVRKVYDGPSQTAQYSSKKLAKLLGVHFGTILGIIHRKTWQHI